MAARDLVSVPLPYSRPPATVQADGTRPDGRGYEELRQVFIQLALNSKAAGSAYTEFNNTKVMCAVYGPRESDRREAYSERGRINCDVRFTTFAGRVRGKASQSAIEREMSDLAEAALEPAVRLETFPKAFVDVYCLVLEADGGELPASICAASLALANAGIAMNDLVAACTVARIDGQLLLDPTMAESEREDGSLTLAVLSSSNLVSGAVMRGEWTAAGLREVMDFGVASCQRLDAVMRETLREYALTLDEPG